MTIKSEMTIQELLDDFPEAAMLFIRKKMACVGCVAEEFHTLEDVSWHYSLGLLNLVSELESFPEIESQGKI